MITKADLILSIPFQILATGCYQRTQLNVVVLENSKSRSRKLRISTHLKSHILSRCPTRLHLQLLFHLHQPDMSFKYTSHHQFTVIIQTPWLTLSRNPSHKSLRLTGPCKHNSLLTTTFHQLRLLCFLHLQLLCRTPINLASMHQLLHPQLNSSGQYHHQILAFVAHHVQGHIAHFRVQQLGQPGLKHIKKWMM